jgi:hypothetical protein
MAPNGGHISASGPRSCGALFSISAETESYPRAVVRLSPRELKGTVY